MQRREIASDPNAVYDDTPTPWWAWAGLVVITLACIGGWSWMLSLVW